MSADTRILLGSKNPDKIGEVKAILGDVAQWLTIEQHPFANVEEDGETIEDNARKKASSICKETQLVVLAEDTGLEVDALHGAPGVFSARYAGEEASYEDNVAKLLGELRGQAKRRARFRCVCIVCFPDGRELLAQGQLPGAILTAPRGRGGFGYDPVFLPDGFSKTLAELPSSTKNHISHRARALNAMRLKLAEFL